MNLFLFPKVAQVSKVLLHNKNFCCIRVFIINSFIIHQVTQTPALEKTKTMHTNCFENPNIDLSKPHKNISKVGDRKKVKSSRTQRYSCQARNFSCSILDPWVKPCPSHVTCICAGFQNFCFLWPCIPFKNDCCTSEITILLFSQHPKIQALIHNILPP